MPDRPARRTGALLAASTVLLAVLSTGPGLALADTSPVPPEWQAAPTPVEGVRPQPLADMTPWSSPTMPPYCTDAQISSGAVAGCVLRSVSGQPEDRGWPTPAYPQTPDGPVVAWVTLAQGASGPTVVKVQAALTAAGFPTSADGQYGPATASSVRAFQAARSLPVTGEVDAATAAALNVTNNAPGTPFPPAGWTWLGWAYNGSVALRPFEATMVGNRTAFATVRANQLRAFPDALALFEGFAREVAAGGYPIRDIGTYAFRCTSNSGRKDCYGLTRDSLSNHAYGLALDVNTAANPELTYRAPATGGTACSVPVRTDIPRWVVQVAERWGLFWGGYGWSGGCQTPSTQKTSLVRDPMHFEFRGTPEQARAIASRNLAGTTGLCLDVVDSSGATVQRCAPGGLPGAGWRIPVTIDAPPGATAALVNVALVDATQAGYVTVESCGPTRDGLRAWSNGNFAPGTITSNLAIAPLGDGSRFCIYVAAPVHVVVDVQGFVTSSGARLSPPGSARVLDTRSAGGARPGGLVVQVPPAAPDGSTGALTNLAVVAPSAMGYVTADACPETTPGAQTRSNLNHARLETVSNLSLVPAADRTFCLVPSASTDVLVDVQGWLVDGGAWGIDLVPAARLVDTRGCRDAGCGVAVPAGSLLRVMAPAGAAAVLANLTITGPASGGFLTAGPCNEVGALAWSNANFDRGETAANLALVRVGADGTFCVRPSTTTHLIVDLAASVSAGGGSGLSPVSPVRVVDTRAR